VPDRSGPDGPGIRQSPRGGENLLACSRGRALKAVAVSRPSPSGAASRLAARDTALPWTAGIGDVTAGTCHLATNAAGDTTLVSCEFTYADGSKPYAVWAVMGAVWHGVPACLMLADDLPEARARLAGNAKIAGAEVLEVPEAPLRPGPAGRGYLRRDQAGPRP
jgi:hypothetical protein